MIRSNILAMQKAKARFDTTDVASEATKYDYDYFLKDHLGMCVWC